MSATILLGTASLAPIAQDLAICLIAAVLFALFLHGFGVPHAIGFIAAGAAIGPQGFAFVSQPDEIRLLADLGVVLLLFLLGVEFDIAGLGRRGRRFVLACVSQVPATVLVGAIVYGLVVAAAGLGGLGTEAVYIGIVCAFSSTLLVVKALEEKPDLGATVGGICIGLLLAQDLWALTILAVQPSAGLNPAALAAPIVGTLLVSAVAAVIGRTVITRVLERFQGDANLLGLTAVAWCLAVAIFAGSLESLSAPGPLLASSGPGVGAFVAGAAIAGPARKLLHQLMGLRDFFILLFFVSLGMTLPLRPDPAELGHAAGIFALVLLCRIAVLYPLLRFGQIDRPTTRAVTAQMSPVSEFALVIAYVGFELGHISEETVAAIALAFVGTVLTMPVFMRRLGRSLPRDRDDGHTNPVHHVGVGLHRAGPSATTPT